MIVLRSALALLAIGGVAVGQCTTVWQPGPPIPGTDQQVVAAVAWDPDAAGPLAPVMVLGGDFRAAGNVAADHVVVLDPVTQAWSPLGGGTNGRVRALAVLPNGELVAAGSFTTAGGVAASRIARFDGTTWHPLGTGLDANAYTLAVRPNGELFVGGELVAAGGAPVNHVACWAGGTWSALATGTSTAVFTLAVLPNGDVVAGGQFQQAGGQPSANLARWDGTAWSSLGACNGYVLSSAVLGNGDLVVSGAFTSIGGVAASRAARWDGASWSPLGTGLLQPANALAARANGDVVAVADGVWRWDGSAWTQLTTTGPTVVTAIEAPNGDLVVGGPFSEVDTVVASNVARWDGTAWSWLGAVAPVGALGGLTAMADGSAAVIVNSPTFTARVMRWDGSAWTQLGGDFNGWLKDIDARDGWLFVVGTFSSVGGTPVVRVARWDGAAWQSTGTPPDVRRLHALRGGAVLASVNGPPGTHPPLARWDPIAGWTFVGTPLIGNVTQFVVTAADEIVVVIWPFSGTQPVWRWTGVHWTLLPGVVGNVDVLRALPDGGLVVAGNLSLASGGHRVARWNGSTWSAAAEFDPYTQDHGLAVLPNGDLVVTGVELTPHGTAAAGIVRGDGYGTSTQLAELARGIPTRVVARPDGGLWVWGETLRQLDDAVGHRILGLATTCPAAASVAGQGCAGGAGVVTLRAETLPWTGATFRSRATGLAANALALDVRGFSVGSTPLAALVPQGVPGCDLLVSADHVGLVVPTAGEAALAWPIPELTALAGVVVHQQVVPVELDASGNLLAVLGTNRLSLTVGSF